WDASGMTNETPEAARKTGMTVAFTSLVSNDVPWQSPNPSGRQGTTQSPCRIQARARRKVRRAILHHLLGREGCSSVSLRGVGADRAEACRSFKLQPREEETTHPHKLLRASS